MRVSLLTNLHTKKLLTSAILFTISIVPILSVHIKWTGKLLHRKISPDDIVQVYFLSREMNSSIVLTPKNVLYKLNYTDWDVQRPTMYIIHGYINNHRSSINIEIASAVLENSDWNIFILDWGEIAKKFYSETKKSIKNVAEELAKFISATHQDHDLITLVGHSLGAHVAGLASRYLNGTINQIVALDPAGPLFEKHNPLERIRAIDAKIVQAIHTCVGYLGMMNPVGKADFYPEGGFPDNQPGCRKMNMPIKILCAHGRAYRLYGESIRSGGILATKCKSYKDFSEGKCMKNVTAYMGTLQLDQSAQGIYYLKTSEKPPYTLSKVTVL